MSDTQSSVNQSEPEKSALGSTFTHQETVPWSIRVYAKLIDSALVWGIYTVLWIIGMYFIAQGHTSIGWLFYIVACIEGVIGWCWVIYQTGATGQSIGKRIMRTRIVGRNGLPLGFWHALLHETVQLFVDMLPLCIGYLWPLVDKKGQTFSDKITGTQTLRVPD